MDGNGRWGLKKKKSRNAGHKAGLFTVEKIIKENLEAPRARDLIFSPDIYVPLTCFFLLIILTIILKKFFYKKKLF